MSDRKLLKVNLLLDDISRIKMRSNLHDMVIYGVNIISDLRELDDQALNKSRIVIILEDALKKGGLYSDLLLYKEIFSLEYIFIGTDPVLLKKMESIAECSSMDVSVLDYNKLYAVIYNDRTAKKEFSKIETLDYLVLANDILKSEYDSRVKRLASAFISLYQMLDSEQDRNRSLQEELNTCNLELANLRDRCEILTQLQIETLDRSREVNSSLKQLEVILSKDVYDKVQLNRYPNKPKILYFKEYEEILHINSFISTLFELFKIQAKLSVKVLRLYDSSGSRKIMTLPKYYKIIQNTFIRRDVISSDFVAKVGGYKEILDIILTNHVGLDLLIIVDCKDHSDTILNGNFISYAMCRNPDNLSVFNLDKNSTIVSWGDSRLCWESYQNYSSLNDKERFLFLSSRTVMQDIYETTVSR